MTTSKSSLSALKSFLIPMEGKAADLLGKIFSGETGLMGDYRT
jgi:hypothetical protein